MNKGIEIVEKKVLLTSYGFNYNSKLLALKISQAYASDSMFVLC